jgi:[ribosomal protein S5]-alanine N-acetyltransferase
MTTVLETERLQLREMVPGDLDFVATMLADPEVTYYYERRFTRGEANAWLDRQLNRYAHDGHGLWLVIERTTSSPIGQVGLAMQELEGVRRPEIGWLLHRPFWGKGYATEAGIATRDAAFSRWGYGEVISLIRPVNRPSRRVAERVGMRAGEYVQFHGFEHIVYVVEASQAALPHERMRPMKRGNRAGGQW